MDIGARRIRYCVGRSLVNRGKLLQVSKVMSLNLTGDCECDLKVGQKSLDSCKDMLDSSVVPAAKKWQDTP
jgi:hypothetical protein